MSQSSAKQRSSARPGQSDRAGAGVQYFAVLETRRTAADAVALHVQDTVAGQSRLEFRPIPDAADAGFMLGTIDLRPDQSRLRMSSVSVRRGRAGSKKQAETLSILQKFPRSLQNWPKVRKRGLVKGIEAIAADLAELTPTGLRWWLVLELALHGIVHQEALLKAGSKFGLDQVPEIPGLLTAGKWYLAPQFLKGQLDKLASRLSAKRTANPFRDQLDLWQLTRLLKLKETPVLCLLLTQFSALHKLQPAESWRGIAVKLPLGDFAPVPHKAHADLADEIVALYQSNEGIPLSGLERRYASHRNMIAWLLDAGHLVDNGTGYLFTRDQLLAHLKAIHEAKLIPEKASVRQLKDELQLSRREAEALRTLLQAEPMIHLAPASPREGLRE